MQPQIILEEQTLKQPRRKRFLLWVLLAALLLAALFWACCRERRNGQGIKANGPLEESSVAPPVAALDVTADPGDTIHDLPLAADDRQTTGETVTARETQRTGEDASAEAPVSGQSAADASQDSSTGGESDTFGGVGQRVAEQPISAPSFVPITVTEDPGRQAQALWDAQKQQTAEPFLDEKYDAQDGQFSVADRVYAEADSYEIRTVWGTAEQVATLRYHYPTGAQCRIGGQWVIVDEEAEQQRVQQAVQTLLPEQAEAVWRDFLTMRSWPEIYRKQTGDAALPWSSYTYGRYYGSRYVLFCVTEGALEVRIYPEGYSDTQGELPLPGEKKEFYVYHH